MSRPPGNDDSQHELPEVFPGGGSSRRSGWADAQQLSAGWSILRDPESDQRLSYAYNHPLMTEEMKIYSDSKISDFLSKEMDDQRVAFLNEWNRTRDHREKIYISYDSTNKVCQAGDINLAEIRHSKEGSDKPIFNYAVAWGNGNREPCFYEAYPGSIVDVSQLQFMLEKAEGQ